MGGGRIHILSDEVISQIAAGEVVERPASVLKELLENAIDAGARHVEVQVAAGGRKAIVVTDDGCGMDRDDALLAIERHATSKIRSAADIERVATLGFRGEALAAIAAVSRLTLTTRPAEAIAGTRLVVAGGKILEVSEVGCPVGTSVEVRHLFFNVPARRKFLRTEATELAHVRQTFLTYALAQPGLALRLVVDGTEVWRMPAPATLEERVRLLLGEDLTESLRPVQHERAGLRVTGLAGTPHVSRADRAGQYVFVNGRPASAPILAHALREAYQGVLPSGRHAILFLFLEMDPAQVDVNVHPTKREVRFRRPGEVRDAVIEAVRSALTAPGGMRAAAPAAWGRPAGAEVGRVEITDIPPPRTFQYPRLPLAPEPSGGAAPVLPESGATAPPERGPKEPPGERPWVWCRVVGQVGGLYVVLETEDGMVLMDPHAAHERVLFERLTQEVLRGRAASQRLLVPETVRLSPTDALRVREHLAVLQEMGFGVSDFGGDTFLVDGLPACLGEVTAAAVLRNVAAELAEEGSGTDRKSRRESAAWAREQVARAACRAAVKARTRLTLGEIEQLVVDLARAAMPYTCPHGRPTLIFMGFDELDRKFGRTS